MEERERSKSQKAEEENLRAKFEQEEQFRREIQQQEKELWERFGDPYPSTFHFRNRFFFTIISKLSKNEQKQSMWKLKNFHHFCPQDIESCHHAAARRVKL